MTDYMKEAERLAQAYADAVLLGEGNDEALAALLAHIQRGVPDGDDGKRVLREVFALCEDTETKCSDETGDFARGRRFEAKGIARAIGAWYQDEFCGRAHMGEPAAVAPDQFRDAAKMMAEPADGRIAAAIHYPECWDTAAYPTVESALSEVYAHYRCTEHDAPTDVPMPEPDTHCYDEDERRDVWSHSADQMRTYGAACRAAGEAAGYAQGLKEAGRDAEIEALRLYVHALCKAVDAATDFAGTVAGGASWWDDVWADHAAALDRARERISQAALRGKVKP